MTPDQLPAGLPMDDKIEAWRNGLLQLVLKHARLYSDHEDAGVVEAAYVAICDYLRTTPEGYLLVPVEPTEAMLQAEIDAVSDYWFDHEELGNGTEATKIGYKAMLAASQESAALKEQSKC